MGEEQTLNTTTLRHPPPPPTPDRVGQLAGKTAFFHL